MKQFFSYYIQIFCDDDDSEHEIFRSDDFSQVQDMFFKLAALDLRVCINYDTWWSSDQLVSGLSKKEE